VADLAPVYLIHGTDHGAVAERRASLRRLAESEGAELETLAAAGPDEVAGALSTLTLALGARVIIADGVERWREPDLAAQLLPALRAVPPRTTLALVSRDDERSAPPAALLRAVEAAGGRTVAHMTLTGRELAGWLREQAARLGIELDNAAAHALIEHVGERQQRLLREVECLALEADAGASIAVETATQRAASAHEVKAADLACRLIAADGAGAVFVQLEQLHEGNRPGSLAPRSAWRLLAAARAMRRLQAGGGRDAAQRELRMRRAEALQIAAALDGANAEQTERLLDVLARLEVDTRGGGPLRSRASHRHALGAQTVELLALRDATS
jgi:DNA polymerase-3 subunit delta